MDIILPMGISFYTFQTLSYTFDVYKKKLAPTRDILAFFGFVSFFPQLVAGPIERASHLLGQFYSPRKFDYSIAVSGVRLVVWGLFKKLVIADNAAILVDEIFINYQDQNSLSLILGAVLFALQIYGDFSGYSDIALGNIIGSNIFNILSVLGFTAIIKPIENVDYQILHFDIYWLLGFAFILLPMVFLPKRNNLAFKEGVLLVLAYAVFIYLTIK